MRAAIFEHWKPDWRSFWKYALLTQIPIFFLAYRTKRLFVSGQAVCCQNFWYHSILTNHLSLF